MILVFQDFLELITSVIVPRESVDRSRSDSVGEWWRHTSFMSLDLLPSKDKWPAVESQRSFVIFSFGKESKETWVKVAEICLLNIQRILFSKAPFQMLFRTATSLQSIGRLFLTLLNESHQLDERLMALGCLTKRFQLQRTSSNWSSFKVRLDFKRVASRSLLGRFSVALSQFWVTYGHDSRLSGANAQGFLQCIKLALLISPYFDTFQCYTHLLRVHPTLRRTESTKERCLGSTVGRECNRRNSELWTIRAQWLESFASNVSLNSNILSGTETFHWNAYRSPESSKRPFTGFNHTNAFKGDRLDFAQVPY